MPLKRYNLQAARKARGMTQQQVADFLGVTLRYYQKLEYAESSGTFEVWDVLEELLSVHQRKLRETAKTRPGKEESQ